MLCNRYSENKLSKVLALTALCILASCGVKQGDLESSNPGRDGSPGYSEEFNYQTVKPVRVEIVSAYKNMDFDLVDINNKKLATLKTDEKGYAMLNLSMSTVSTKLGIMSDLIGMPTDVFLDVVNNAVKFDFTRNSINALNYQMMSKSYSSQSVVNNVQVIDGFPAYKTLGAWDYSGIPDYLVEPVDVSLETIKKLNDALPNYEPVPEYRPQYLMDDVDTDIHLIKDGEVFVTFVHEGAGYRNSFGFYTYKTSDGPPTRVERSDVTLIFPNVSYRYSGGNLQTGDTVSLGDHKAGTSIGWVLMSNAYSSRFRGVGTGFNTFFSENLLNPDVSPYQQHFVQIDLGEFVVLGIEDLLRPGGDNDFNDAVFTISATPNEAISKDGMVKETGVNKTEPEVTEEEITLKETPNFEVVGYQFFPGKDEFGTLAFEDLWPHKGDYDFNDLVVDYNVIEALDKNNEIVQIQLSLKIVGILASMNNGFGIQLGVEPELVASVVGSKLTKGYTVLHENGTEKRQEKAVIIAFEEAQAHYNSESPEDSEEIVISINFTRGVTRQELGFAPYNPFIMSNGERGREIHLPGYQATDLVHLDYFGSEDDQSVIGTSYMYKTLDDLPWAIHLPEKFAYPYDSVRINEAYELFEAWVESDGFSHSDWYTDKPGYRNADRIVRNYVEK